MTGRVRTAAAIGAFLLIVQACTSTGSSPSDSIAVDPVEPPSSEQSPTAPTTSGDGTTVAGNCWSAPALGTGGREVSLRDATEDFGLIQPLVGMHAHAMAFGDVNADGWVDLFVGTFADRDEEKYQHRGASGPSPDRLLLGGPGGFIVDAGFPEEFARTSGAAFADLDGDGDPDLVAARNFLDREGGRTPTTILENRGTSWEVATEIAGGEFGGRSVGVLDYDGDGLLDLFVAEDRWRGGSSRLFRNSGGLLFEDVTGDAGFPDDVHGLGVGVADLNGDGWSDIFVAGSNRLFLATGEGGFVEANDSVFEWPVYGDEDDVAGIVIADVNRDGLADIVLGQHYNSTIDDGEEVPVRLYLNDGIDDQGTPRFRDVTEEAGLIPLPTKAPGVDVADFDNDGWPDLLTTASADGGTRPAIFRHLGLTDGVPRFEAPDGMGDPQYWVTGASSDVNHDGRLDVFVVEWEPTLPSLLLENVGDAGHWLSIEVKPEAGTGVGALVEIYEPGGLGDPEALLGAREVTASLGYGAGTQGAVHFGLGDGEIVDLRVRLPNGGAAFSLEGVAADQHVAVPGGCT